VLDDEFVKFLGIDIFVEDGSSANQLSIAVELKVDPRNLIVHAQFKLGNKDFAWADDYFLQNPVGGQFVPEEGGPPALMDKLDSSFLNQMWRSRARNS